MHLALPYEKGNIEGSHFVFNWIAYIWNIEIRIWSAETTTLLATFHSVEKASKIFNVIRYQTDIGNFYFEPLSPIKRNIENKNMSLRILKKMIRNTVVPNQEIVGTNLNVDETKRGELSLEFKSCKESNNIVKRKRQGFSYQNRKKQKQTSITLAEQEFKKMLLTCLSTIV